MIDSSNYETPFAERLEQVIGAIARRSDEFQEQLNAMPQQVACSRHPAQIASLDHDASFKQAMPVYRCLVCDKEGSPSQQDITKFKLLAAGVPSDVIHASFDNFDTERTGVIEADAYKTPQQFLEAAKSFAKGEARNLFLCGPPGIGKGHLASSVARKFIESGRSVVWAECQKIFNEIHASYAISESERILRKYSRPDLLVLDEICFRTMPADGEEILFFILSPRYQNGMQTILLGNMQAWPTKQWLGARISDRLRSGGVRFMYGVWDSMRGGELDGTMHGKESEF